MPEGAKPTILSTPDDRDRFRILFDLPGYAPKDSGISDLQESFPIHDHDWKDSVFYKDYEVDAVDFDPSKEENHNKLRRDNRYGKLYQDAKDNKVWYSKERSGDRAHAGEHWKRFRQEGGNLIHDADVDLTGKVMSKHKSNVGIKIILKNTIGIK